MSFKMSAAIA